MLTPYTVGFLPRDPESAISHNLFKEYFRKLHPKWKVDDTIAIYQQEKPVAEFWFEFVDLAEYQSLCIDLELSEEEKKAFYCPVFCKIDFAASAKYVEQAAAETAALIKYFDLLVCYEPDIPIEFSEQGFIAKFFQIRDSKAKNEKRHKLIHHLLLPICAALLGFVMTPPRDGFRTGIIDAVCCAIFTFILQPFWLKHLDTAAQDLKEGRRTLFADIFLKPLTTGLILVLIVCAVVTSCMNLLTRPLGR